MPILEKCLAEIGERATGLAVDVTNFVACCHNRYTDGLGRDRPPSLGGFCKMGSVKPQVLTRKAIRYICASIFVVHFLSREVCSSWIDQQRQDPFLQ